MEESRNGERRPRALWRLLIQYTLSEVASVFFTAPVLLVALGVGVLASGATDPAWVDSLPVDGLVTLFAVLATVWFCGLFLDRRPLKDFGLRLNREWWIDLGFGLALGAALMTGIFLVEAGMGWIEITGGFEAPGSGFWPAILGPAVFFVCVGIYEELLSRGYQIKNISEGLGGIIGARAAILVAWLLTSMIFSLGHTLNPGATVTSTINITLAGLMLGAGYVLSGQLAIPIGLHITWNFFQANVFGFPVSGLESSQASFVSVEQGGPETWTGGPFGPEAGLLTVFATLIGTALILLWIRLRSGKAGLYLPLAARPGDQEPG